MKHLKVERGIAADVPWDVRALESLAPERLSPPAAAYFESIAGYPPTSRENERTRRSWRFVPRVGVDVSDVSTAAAVLGSVMPAPILLAPSACAGEAHPEAKQPDLFVFAAPAGPGNPAGPLNPAVTWTTVAQIAGMTSLPVLVKGLLRAR